MESWAPVVWSPSELCPAPGHTSVRTSSPLPTAVSQEAGCPGRASSRLAGRPDVMALILLSLRQHRALVPRTQAEPTLRCRAASTPPSGPSARPPLPPLPPLPGCVISVISVLRPSGSGSFQVPGLPWPVWLPRHCWELPPRTLLAGPGVRGGFLPVVPSLGRSPSRWERSGRWAVSWAGPSDPCPSPSSAGQSRVTLHAVLCLQGTCWCGRPSAPPLPPHSPPPVGGGSAQAPSLQFTSTSSPAGRGGRRLTGSVLGRGQHPAAGPAP